MTTTVADIRAASSREKFYGWLAGKLIVRAARLALLRNDRHEFAHLRAAIAAGNTGADSHLDGCPLDGSPASSPR